MGHFDADEEKEREKREKRFESLMQSKSGIMASDKSLLGDIKMKQKEITEKFHEKFEQIDSVKRHKLIQLAIKTNDTLKKYPQGKKFDGDSLMRMILEETDDILYKAEAGYVIKVMCNKGYIKHIDAKNLPLCSREQTYMINR